MKREDMDFRTIPRTSGIYIFRGTRNTILYVGRATDLRSRVRSYFSDTLLGTRGPRLTEAIEKTKTVETVPTDSVLEAYILEAHLIKTHEPMYNVVDKDDRSFQYVCITDEEFPRVLTVRGRTMGRGAAVPCRHMFGPFPRGGMLRDALRTVRKILPYRDTCVPYDGKTDKKPRPCLRAELGLCPGVCDGTMNAADYAKRIREIVMLFRGRKKELVRNLERTMKTHAKRLEFERAEEVRRRIFALTHIRDIALIKGDVTEPFGDAGKPSRSFRIEAYDIAHLAGTDTVGVMVVMEDDEPAHAEYRTFTIRDATPGDDIGALREMLGRRINHPEWRFPNLIVTDGGAAHMAAAEKVLRNGGMTVPVVSVVKNEKHMPRAVLGPDEYARGREKTVIRANAEAHRFAVSRHRKKRTKSLLR